MSETDSFIDEVTEEVRRDRVYRLIRKWGWLALLAVLLIVAGAAWNEWRKAKAEAEAQALGDALFDAVESDEAEARIAALGAVETEGAGVAIAALLTAAEYEAEGDAAAAAEALAAITTNPDVPEDYRALATLKSLMLSEGTMDEAARRAGLEALAQPGQSYRMIALEQLALADVAAGDAEAALERLAAILEDAETGQSLRDRAQGLVIALGGELPGAAAE